MSIVDMIVEKFLCPNPWLDFQLNSKETFTPP